MCPLMEMEKNTDPKACQMVTSLIRIFKGNRDESLRFAISKEQIENYPPNSEKMMHKQRSWSFFCIFKSYSFFSCLNKVSKYKKMKINRESISHYFYFFFNIMQTHASPIASCSKYNQVMCEHADIPISIIEGNRTEKKHKKPNSHERVNTDEG